MKGPWKYCLGYSKAVWRMGMLLVDVERTQENMSYCPRDYREEKQAIVSLKTSFSQRPSEKWTHHQCMQSEKWPICQDPTWRCSKHGHFNVIFAPEIKALWEMESHVTAPFRTLNGDETRVPWHWWLYHLHYILICSDLITITRKHLILSFKRDQKEACTPNCSKTAKRKLSLNTAGKDALPLAASKRLTSH